MSYIVKEFKPCPFCGRVWMTVDSSEDEWKARCMCGATGPKATGRVEAIKMWNIRDQHLLWNPFRFSVRFPKNTLEIDFKGNLDSIDLATILQMLASKEKTGILQIARGHARSVICLREGYIIAASDSKGLRLGQILYKHGMISQKRLKSALNMVKKSDRMLGEVLLFMGYIDKDTLHNVVQQQVQEAVLELFFWEDGAFEYRDCKVEFDADGIHAINTMEIIMEAARRMDEWDEVRKKKEIAEKKKMKKNAAQKALKKTKTEQASTKEKSGNRNQTPAARLKATPPRMPSN